MPSDKVPPLIVPVVWIVLEPVLIFPKPELIEPLLSVPTLVNEELVTPEPNVELLNTEDPLILY